MCNKKEDLIDFPCSNTFLDYYYEKGLTPRHSPDYYRLSPENLKLFKELLEEVKTLNSLLRARAKETRLNELID